MPHYLPKLFTCFLAVILIFSFSTAIAGEYSSEYLWNFDNSFFNFDQAITFQSNPFQGIPYINGSVAYWNLNEASGTIAYDSSGNRNNFTISSPIWVDGKYGEALRFNGSNYAVSSFKDLNVTKDFSVSSYINPDSLTGTQHLARRGMGWYLRLEGDALRFFIWCSTTNVICETVSLGLSAGTYYHITAVYNATSKNSHIYLNGVECNYIQNITGSGIELDANASTFFGRSEDPANAAGFNGIIDEIKLFNQALTDVEIATVGIPQVKAFSNYYNYHDSASGNTMLLFVDNSTTTTDSIVLVTCTNFIVNNRLIFYSNKSCSINIWTNLGIPLYNTGIWNSENYTTTLTLDTSSVSELDWNKYNITSQTDSHSKISPGNITANYKDSITFSISADTGYTIENVSVNGVNKGNITAYTLANIQSNYNISVSSSLILSSTTAPTNLSTPTPTPTPTSSLGATTSPTTKPQSVPINPYLAAAVITTIALLTIILCFFIAFKKGYITVRVIRQEPE